MNPPSSKWPFTQRTEPWLQVIGSPSGVELLFCSSLTAAFATVVEVHHQPVVKQSRSTDKFTRHYRKRTPLRYPSCRDTTEEPLHSEPRHKIAFIDTSFSVKACFSLLCAIVAMQLFKREADKIPSFAHSTSVTQGIVPVLINRITE